ncbi:hypothetical protein [Bradyrhizobium sp. NP1]|uniref:diaminopimelate epimerase n=1 Tax=Bradyrhizobium sp. NP1 TaxID=3049772 RepID=UPI0025A4CD5C|nr:hypothetical protein [Bradyrhizobium sp. NP1]WJR76838.1 hypothetical protein QOU61_29410 [Bradyrhizobium sp. NP1]
MIQGNATPSTRLRVFKYHALGNSYLVVDPRDGKVDGWFAEPADGSFRCSAALATWLCDPSRGIGSNGLLVGPVEVAEPDTFGLYIVNSDGTQSAFSGNGIRIFAKYLLDAGYVGEGASIGVRTLLDDRTESRMVAPVHIGEAEDGRIDVTLPHAPQFGSDAIGADHRSIIPLTGDDKGLSFTVKALASIGEALTGVHEAWTDSTFVDIGNPHCTTFVRDPAHLPSRRQLLSSDEALRGIAFRSDSSTTRVPIFAQGANLQWIRVVSRREIDLVVYERGEGPTEASGSSASAAACAACARGLVDRNITVNMPGGSLMIRIVADAGSIVSVTLSGFAARILEAFVDTDGQWPPR